MVKEFPDQFVIKQSDYENIYGKPIDCKQKFIRFDQQLGHQEFYKPEYSEDDPIHPSEKRFTLKDIDLYEKLSKNKRCQTRGFEDYSKRKSVIE